MRNRRSTVISLLCAAVVGAGVLPALGDINQLQQSFTKPADESRMMVRWWWFGPAVTKAGIDRELAAMKVGGIGGVEINPVYPLAVDGGTGENEVKNLKFLSPEHLEMIRYTAAKCKEMNIRMDLTLGSGWPYGGPMFTAQEGTGAISTAVVPAAAGVTSVPFPAAGGRGPRTPIAAFVGPAGAGATAAGGGGGGGRGGRGAGGGGPGADMTAFKEVPIKDLAAQIPPGFAGGEVLFFVDGRTGGGGMQVKRPAVGAEGPVIDHLSAKVVDKFIAEVADPVLKACGENPPYSFFCDSLEASGENWTPDFLAEFQKRRGYDLKPLLPALVGNIGPQTEGVKHDFGQTVTDIFNDNFNAKFKALAAKYKTKYRIQGYGSPPAGLYSYAFADLPEGEAGGNGNWRNFRTTRYAASASHLMGQKVTSSETFTWLHGAPFRATPLDMKGEVDTHFLDGVNQVICHGWPYTGNGAAYPGWSLYAAAVFDDKNPWYVGMPEITGYVHRVSQMLREGTPANDIALYLSDSDVWAGAGTGFSSLNAAHTRLTGMLGEILGWGYNMDGWDDGMLALKGKVEGGALAFGDVKYKVVVLSGAQHMPLATAEKLEAFAKGGGLVVAVGAAPTKVPGLKATAEDQAKLAAIMQGLFTGPGAKGMVVANEAAFGEALSKKLIPDVAVDPVVTAIGAVHRHIDDAELYFVANTSNTQQNVKATFRVEGMTPEMWDPLTGTVKAMPVAGKVAGGTTVALNLPPYGSTIVVWTKRALPAAPVAAAPASAIDISGGWTVKFGDKTVKMDTLTSWTELADYKNYSGVATYERSVSVPAAGAGAPYVLSFEGARAPAAGAPGGRGGQGFAAVLDAPVRDVAVVYVNGERVGAAWCPPYKVELKGLKAGENTIRIDVGNTAVNHLAKAGFPNYDNAAVRAKYGNRFDPQGVPLLSTPLPSGLLGTVKLERE